MANLALAPARSIRASPRVCGYLLVAALSCAVLSARAAEPEPLPTTQLPKVIVTAHADSSSCMGDEAAHVSYDCLNAELTALVARQHNPQSVLRTVVSQSVPRTPTAQGLYNQTATRIRMGGNFGISVYPHRPSPNTRNPLIH
jgi:hypothetical protein